LIPAGDYTIGSPASDPNRQSNEYPQWTAVLSAFCMKRTEVTVAEFRACRTAGRCVSDPPAGGNWGVAGRDNHPINMVDWNQAADFCAWSGGRLPTEAEWEGAARGPTWQLYPWGGAAPTNALANFNGTNGGTQEVALAGLDRCNNPFGLCDMAGNVLEWVNDWIETYPTGPVTDPTGPASGTVRVNRGGGWVYLSVAFYLRASSRGGDGPTVRDYVLGFRCARGVR
jgi:formylglycine-generating enzyme required for sulfatase activity